MKYVQSWQLRVLGLELQQVWERLAAFFALWNVDNYCSLSVLLPNFLRVILVMITILVICLLT